MNICVRGKFLHCLKNYPILKRFSSTDFSNTYLEYESYGEPISSLNANNTSISKEQIHNEIKKGNIFVKLLASPINPADINKIEGNYATRPSNLPIVAGTEGVGQVLESSDEKLRKGDKVIFAGSSFMGTWQQYGFFDRESLIKIPSNVHTIFASMLLVNPCTAYMMLKNIVPLKIGDTIIQNGANSSVGQFVIQLAHIFGINTINIIRNRENVESLIGYLQILGANSVIIEEDMKKEEAKSIISKYSPPKLALNCIGGQNCLNMLSYLEKDATLVTYGGMSKKPVILPTKYLIFKNLRAIGFMLDHDSFSVEAAIGELCKLVNRKLLTPPLCKTFALEDYKNALKFSMTPFNNHKSIFICNKDTL